MHVFKITRSRRLIKVEAGSGKNNFVSSTLHGTIIIAFLLKRHSREMFLPLFSSIKYLGGEFVEISSSVFSPLDMAWPVSSVVTIGVDVAAVFLQLTREHNV